MNVLYRLIFEFGLVKPQTTIYPLITDYYYAYVLCAYVEVEVEVEVDCAFNLSYAKWKIFQIRFVLYRYHTTETRESY